MADKEFEIQLQVAETISQEVSLRVTQTSPQVQVGWFHLEFGYGWLSPEKASLGKAVYAKYLARVKELTGGQDPGNVRGNYKTLRAVERAGLDMLEELYALGGPAAPTPTPPPTPAPAK